MDEIIIKVPEGKEARLVGNVLTFVDKKFKAGEKAILTDDINVDNKCNSLIYAGAKVEIIEISNPKYNTYKVKCERDGHVDIGYAPAYKLQRINNVNNVKFKFEIGDEVQNWYDHTFTYTVVGQLVRCDLPTYTIQCPAGIIYAPEDSLVLAHHDITNNIKTFEDACKWCTENGYHDIRREYDCIVTDSLILDEVSPNLIAYLKLRIITAALNEGWGPTFKKREVLWCVEYDCIDNICEVNYHSDWATSSVKLCFKSEKLANYAAVQFRDIYADFLRGEERGLQLYSSFDYFVELDHTLFPEVKWEDEEPTEVEILVRNLSLKMKYD